MLVVDDGCLFFRVLSWCKAGQISAAYLFCGNTESVALFICDRIGRRPHRTHLEIVTLSEPVNLIIGKTAKMRNVKGVEVFKFFGRGEGLCLIHES